MKRFSWEVAREARTVVMPERTTRVLVRHSASDKPGYRAYVSLDVSSTGFSSGVEYEKVCRSARCCGRPKATEKSLHQPGGES